MCRYNNIRQAKALTFLELVIALVIFTVAMVGFLGIFNTALNSGFRATQEIIATNLARALTAEIMAKDFADSDFPNNPLGPDIDPGSGDLETRHGGGNASFDDVDDYNGYAESPPISVGNVVLNGSGGSPDYSDFTRSVYVLYLDLATNQTSQFNPTNYKQIMVTTAGPFVSNITMYGVKTNLTAP